MPSSCLCTSLPAAAPSTASRPRWRTTHLGWRMSPSPSSSTRSGPRRHYQMTMTTMTWSEGACPACVNTYIPCACKYNDRSRW
ncbi:hypothetical protein JKP88DRAFT_347759, partial [Tribonema minus]